MHVMKNIYLERLRFQLWQARIRTKEKFWEMFRAEPDAATIEARIAELNEEVQSEEYQEIEQYYQEYLAAEPKLAPRRTMLLGAREGENRCNYQSAPNYRRFIRRAYRWGQDHGITCFLCDTSSPFGLLAVETLLELRDEGEKLHLYAFQSKYPHFRKSYRLIPETEIEYLLLLHRTEYNYQRTAFSSDAVQSKAGTLCSERGIWAIRERLPEYLLKTWGGA